MNDILAVTLPFFALVLCGYLAAWRGVLAESAIPGLNGFVLFFALPCMLFRFGMNTPVLELLNPAVLGTYLIAAALIVALTIAITLSARVHLKDAAFGALVAAFPNTGFMGVPLLVALLGPAAAGPVICTILADLFFTSSLCIAIARAHDAGNGRAAAGQALKSAIRGALSNPLPWAIALGAAVSISGLRPPGPVDAVIKMLADAATPVALFTIGAVLWRAGRHAHSRTPVVLFLPVALIKLIAHPALVFGLGTGARALGAPLSDFQLLVLTLAAALPSASNVSLLAERYGADNGRVARIILASTALAFLSFTGLAWLMLGQGLTKKKYRRQDMQYRFLLTAALGLLALASAAPAQADANGFGYQQPSAALRELLDAPAQPRLLIAPDRQTLATLELRRFTSIEELARPVLRLAGLRFDPASATPQATTPIQRLKLRSLLNPDAPERVVDLPPGGSFHSFAWSPDGQRFLLERRMEAASELWVGDSASGRIRPIAYLRLSQALLQGELTWLNPRELVVTSVPDRRGTAPQTSRAPSGPAVQENQGRVSPERTYPDLLKNTHDEALFEYHARTELTLVDVVSGSSRDLGATGLFSSISSVGDGQYLLTERLVRPFSYSLSWEDFPRVVELRNREGRVLRELARVPLKQGVAVAGVVNGPRAFFASPGSDAAVFWVEALDGGNPNAKVAFRDRIMRLDPPFTGEPQEVQRMPHRFARLAFLDDGQHALMTEIDRQRAWTRTYLLPLNGSQSKPLFDHSTRERYRHPGTPMTRVLPHNGRTVVMAAQGELLLSGPGAGPKGERPFLDRFSLKDLSSTRMFQSGEAWYEQPLALLDGGRLVTQRESLHEPPNLFLRDGTGTSALTRIKDPTPQLRKVRRELVSFKRADGVELSFWLYLPPDYKEGERRPGLVWAYPLEFADDSTAGQVSGSANRFAAFPGLSPLHLLMDGFVVLSDATMPIVGDPKVVNDSFVEQITMNARAILDKAEELGVVDIKRMAVGGHSYGAFMTVNLLAHTDLFKAGIARSGAYNRTLTPFGFQSERRSLWEARDVYLKLSPFLYANQIKEPLLLTHGEADNNSGTFPIQTERLYQALAGTGGTVRYVSLPLESHGYTARESVGHVQWEMSQWLRTHLGEPRGPQPAP